MDWKLLEIGVPLVDPGQVIESDICATYTVTGANSKRSVAPCKLGGGGGKVCVCFYIFVFMPFCVSEQSVCLCMKFQNTH